LIIACFVNGVFVLRIYQVKFSKTYSRRKAVVTTDYKKFYCNRDTGQPLKTHTKAHIFCLKYFQEKNIERYVVTQGRNIPRNDENVQFISETSHPNFFNSFGNEFVWNALTNIQDNL
jgi:hypothetical protein